MNRSRFATYVLPAIAGLALAAAAWSIARHVPQARLTEPLVTPPTAPATEPATIGAVGLVESTSEEIGIPATTAGPVTELKAVPGLTVKAGDVLFVIDDRQARADLAVRRADLDSARARLSEAEASAADMADQLARSERLAKLSPGVAISEDTLLRRRYAARTADAHVETAKAEVASAEASVHSAEVALERMTVRAPIDGTILQVNVRLGEYAPAATLATPLVIMGQLTPLHIRADIDETDVPRFDPAAPAWASPRGAAGIRLRLTPVRVDPLVVPKVSLTGGGAERVDTRVLRVVYALDPAELARVGVHAYPGQQMDLFVALKP
jgi:RND family efflux transporter MFP subunit